MTLNKFRHIETIEAGDSQSLASLLRKIPCAYQIVQIYSDGKRHFAVIDPGKDLKKDKRFLKLIATGE